MYFHISLIPRGAYFLLPLESKQEATSGWNFTKCISEVKVNQLKLNKWNFHFYIHSIDLPFFQFADIRTSNKEQEKRSPGLAVCISPSKGGAVRSCRELPKQFYFARYALTRLTLLQVFTYRFPSTVLRDRPKWKRQLFKFLYLDFTQEPAFFT